MERIFFANKSNPAFLEIISTWKQIINESYLVDRKPWLREINLNSMLENIS